MTISHRQHVSDWSATITAVGSSPDFDEVTLSTADISDLADKVGQTALTAGQQGIPVSLFDSAGEYLGAAHIVEYDSSGSGMDDDMVILDNNGFSTLDAGGTLACRINPEWVQHSAAHRHVNAHTQGSGTLTLDQYSMGRDITVTASCTIELPHSTQLQATWGGIPDAQQRHDLTIWLYDNDNDQPAVTISGQTLFYVTDTVRWADGSAPAFSGGYRLLQLRLTMMGGGSTWLGTWDKFSDR